MNMDLKAEMTAQTEIWLLRISRAYCDLNGYHIAKVVVGRVHVDPADPKTFRSEIVASDDPGVQACSCGYRFADHEVVTRCCCPVLRLKDGREMTYQEAPKGTWWDHIPYAGQTGPDRPDVEVAPSLLPQYGEWQSN